ncbi:MAG: SDR family oxidoreductase [Nitrososphaerota archaeon]|nr:SDR family oxidoreductase [Nitrososphaerota archaeon]
MNSGLAGQRVLVTASSAGIGFGAAEAFLKEGARVVINSSNGDKLDAARAKLAPLGDVHSVLGNLILKSDIEKIVQQATDQLGGIDTLVYVTGSPKPGRFLEFSYEDWRAASDLLVVSPAYLTRLVADRMLKDGTRGRMVILSSYVIKEPTLAIALSSVCRVAMLSLVRTLARELGPKGIRVNGILPGFIKTGRIDQLAQDAAKRRGIKPEDYVAELERDIPLGRIGTTEELARAVVFLGSDLSSYVSGASIPVDGAVLRSI